MSSVKVAVILPSRGLMFSQTADEILQNLKGIDYKFYFSHRRPLPECFEEPTNKALKDKAITHLWFVEDDMILSPDTLKNMLKKNKAVVTANYPTTNKGNAAILTIKGRVVYGGTGCTLVKREVFNELKKPYWRSDIAWIPKNKGDFIKFIAVKRKNDGYGFHDVNFFMNLYKLDIPVHTIKETLGQRKLIALGKAGTNDGAHNIEEWRDVEEDRYFQLIKDLPIENEGHMTTVIVDNKEFMCTHEHAQKLLDKGLATKPPKRSVVLDDSEII